MIDSLCRNPPLRAMKSGVGNNRVSPTGVASYGAAFAYYNYRKSYLPL